MRLAIDDAGAGYASFQHVLALNADIIKLDASLTQNSMQSLENIRLRKRYVLLRSRPVAQLLPRVLRPRRNCRPPGSWEWRLFAWSPSAVTGSRVSSASVHISSAAEAGQ